MRKKCHLFGELLIRLKIIFDQKESDHGALPSSNYPIRFMIISLLGYSGIGKSLLARRLEDELGWLRFGCDDLIADRLQSELRDIPGHGETQLANWMGFPWEPHCRERQELYLLLEEQVVDEICDALEEAVRKNTDVNIVVDTTGSCVYISNDVLYRLKKFSQIVFLEASETEEEDLIKRFFDSPKPIIWGEVYQENPGEDHEAAIRRCYPKLLHSRQNLYASLANIELAVPSETRVGWSGVEFLDHLKSLGVSEKKSFTRSTEEN